MSRTGKRRPKQYRIIVDANWYVSATISRNSRRTLRKLFVDSRFQVLISTELLAEYDRVIARPKFKRHNNALRLARLRRLVLQRVSFYPVLSVVTVCRDPKDDYLLALAQDGKADYLISGDPDVVDLGQHNQTRIITMRVFLSRFRLT